jgi:1,4-dihydroxy-2-naphthoate octaprenyltransferase
VLFRSKPASAAIEPRPESLCNPLLRYFLATRPAFLTITLVGCLLGFASAVAQGIVFDLSAAGMTLLLALLTHAGVNVLNDYYDHLNGTDALNTDRLFPFTGGSRFIQNNVFTPRQTLAFGLALFAAVIAGGLWLIDHSGSGLFWIGLAGLLIGWAYSAPPLKLNSRGLGEVSVMAGFLLIVLGADYVQRHDFGGLPWLAGLSYALLTTNILYINQFPDRRADLAAGKRHWVARLEPRHAAWGYALILGLSLATLAGGVLAGALPPLALIAGLGMLPAFKAAGLVLRHADQPGQLGVAIRLTIAAAHIHTALLALLLFLGSRP